MAQQELMVSVLIPVFDTEKYLRESLDSIANQTLKELEVICVDDGSSDSSPEILREFAERDPRFRIFAQQNKGPSDARNWAVRESRGKYLYFMDSDDVLEADCLRQCVEYAEKNALDLVCFDAEPFAENNECPEELEMFRKSYFRRFDYPGICTGAQMLMRMQNNNDIVVAPWASMLRRELFEPNRMWYYPRIAHADVSYSFLAYLSAQRAGYMKKIFFHRRVRPGSIMTGSKLSHHSWSYFCGCKLMTERLPGFHLAPNEEAAAVKYIQVRLNMAQRYYQQMNEKERQETIAKTGVDAPLYMQMVARPAEAKETRTRQHIRYTTTISKLRDTNRLVRQVERYYRRKHRAKFAREIYPRMVQPNEGKEILLPVSQPIPEDSSMTFAVMFRQFTEALNQLSEMELLPRNDPEYTVPLKDAAQKLEVTINAYRQLTAEEREQLAGIDKGKQAFLEMLAGMCADYENQAAADGHAANQAEKMIGARTVYLNALIPHLPAPYRAMLELERKYYASAWARQLLNAENAVTIGVRKTGFAIRRNSSGFRLGVKKTGRDIARQARHTRTSFARARVAYKLHYRPVRLAMLGYYRMQEGGAKGWEKDYLNHLRVWNVSEEYGAGVMVRYQGILDGLRSDLDGSRKQRTFDFRTTSMSCGADEYDFFAKGMVNMDKNQRKQVVTYGLTSFLTERMNLPAASLALKRMIPTSDKTDKQGHLVTANATAWHSTVKVCTLREGEAIRPLFAALQMNRKGKPEKWIAPVEVSSGRIGTLCGSVGGVTEKPVVEDTAVPKWEEILSLCVKTHQTAPFGANLAVWEVAVMNGGLKVIAASDDLNFVDRDVDGNTLRPAVETLIAAVEPNAITLKTPVLSGNTLTCAFEVSGAWSGLFGGKMEMSVTYAEDISAANDGIRMIPFLTQILPVAWAYHAQVKVSVCDKAWLDCLEELAVAMQELYPFLPTASHMEAEKTTHTGGGKGCAVLALDAVKAAYAASLHLEDSPVMLTVNDASVAEEAVKHFHLPVHQAEMEVLFDTNLLRQLTPGKPDDWCTSFMANFAKMGAAIPMMPQADIFCLNMVDPAFDTHVRFGSCDSVHEGFGFKVKDMRKQIERASSMQTEAAEEEEEILLGN